MKVEGTKDFEAPVAVVWDVLMDPSKMAKLLPGVESFEVQDADHWSAAVKVPLGMGGLKLKFQFEQLERRPTEYAKLSSKGQGVGAIVNMQTEFHLDPDGSDRTHMRWAADVRVAGTDRLDGAARLPADREPAGHGRAQRARATGRRSREGG